MKGHLAPLGGSRWPLFLMLSLSSHFDGNLRDRRGREVQGARHDLALKVPPLLFSDVVTAEIHTVFGCSCIMHHKKWTKPKV